MINIQNIDVNNVIISSILNTSINNEIENFNKIEIVVPVFYHKKTKDILKRYTRY